MRHSRIPVVRELQQHGHYSVSAMELQPSVRTEPEPGMFHSAGRRDALCERDEQEKLSGVVKRVHRKLRRKYIEVGDFDKIWREHCEDEQTLNEYAFAMKSLADNHWAKKCDGEGRIEWCRSVCQEYFMDGGMKKMLEKDAKHAAAASGTPLNPDSSQPRSITLLSTDLRSRVSV